MSKSVASAVLLSLALASVVGFVAASKATSSPEEAAVPVAKPQVMVVDQFDLDGIVVTRIRDTELGNVCYYASSGRLSCLNDVTITPVAEDGEWDTLSSEEISQHLQTEK